MRHYQGDGSFMGVISLLHGSSSICSIWCLFTACKRREFDEAEKHWGFKN